MFWTEEILSGFQKSSQLWFGLPVMISAAEDAVPGHFSRNIVQCPNVILLVYSIYVLGWHQEPSHHFPNMWVPSLKHLSQTKHPQRIRDTQKDREATGFVQGHTESFQQSVARRRGFWIPSLLLHLPSPRPLSVPRRDALMKCLCEGTVSRACFSRFYCITIWHRESFVKKLLQ